MPQADDRLIVALDVPDALQGHALAEKLGDSVSFYKIGLGMLTGGGMALANELKDEHGKRIFMDLKLFDIGAVLSEEACEDGGWTIELEMAEKDLRRFLKREDLSAELLEANDYGMERIGKR